MQQLEIETAAPDLLRYFALFIMREALLYLK